MKNFINISDHSSNTLRAIIDEGKARKIKRGRRRFNRYERITPSTNIRTNGRNNY